MFVEGDFERFVKTLEKCKSSFKIANVSKGKIHLYSSSCDWIEDDLKIIEKNGFQIMYKKVEFVDDCFSIVIS